MTAQLVTPLPTPPSRRDPTHFNDRAEAFLLALLRFCDEINAATPGDSAAGLAQYLATAAESGMGGDLVTYLPLGATAVGRKIQAKLREFRTPADLSPIGTNTAIGSAVMELLTSGSNNTAVGTKLLSAATTNSANVAFGREVMQHMTTGNNNTGVGTTVLQGLVGGDNNVGVGLFALRELNSGSNNTAVGTHGTQYLLTGSFNSGFGFGTLMGMTGGDTNTAVGYRSMYAGGDSKTGTGSNNTAVGGYTLRDITTGFGNAVMGLNAGQAITTGAENVAAGSNALAAATTGSGHVAVGTRALLALTTGLQETAVGTDALSATTTGDACTAVGYAALKLNTTGNNNTGVGHQALASSTTAFGSTAVGQGAGAAVTTGSANTLIGQGAGATLSTGHQNTIVGTGSDVGAARFSNTLLGYGIATVNFSGCSLLGNGTAVTADNQVQLGNSATTTYVYGTVQNRSDIRDKADIRDTVLGLDFINALRPVDFRWAYREDGGQKRVRFHHGLIAQEVSAACDRLGIEFGGWQDHSISGGADVQSLGYDELIGPLIRAVQQLSDEVRILRSESDRNRPKQRPTKAAPGRLSSS